MTDHPIIFSAPMVRALLDGRKTMTRRLAWRGHCPLPSDTPYQVVVSTLRLSPWQRVKPGDRLWVRENLKWSEFKDCWLYSADESAVSLDADDPRSAQMVAWAHHREQDYCPSIHMPRMLSRLTLVVTETKMEPLQDIRHADAVAEGVEGSGSTWKDYAGNEPYFINAGASFVSLWTVLHGPDSWTTNPEVVALTFTVHRCNIDAMERAAA